VPTVAIRECRWNGGHASAFALLASTDTLPPPAESPNAAWRSRGACARSDARTFGPRKTEGAGNAGCALHPRSRVQDAHKECAHEHTGSAEAIRHSLRNGFTVSFALPGDRAFLPPSLADRSTSLTPASGCQDHTTSPSAKASFVRALLARLTLPRPSHPAPNVRDDREAPLLWARDGESFGVDLGQLKTNIFLQTGLDRLMGDLPVGH
jgi:hypothetical protein